MNGANILRFAVGPVGAALLGLVSLPVVAWFYSPEDIGRVAMLQVAISFSILFFSLGLDQAYVREFHESAHKGALLQAAIKPGFIFLLAMGLLTLFVPDQMSLLLYGINDVSAGIQTLLCIVAGFVIRFLSLILRMQEKGGAFSFSQILPKFLFLIVILICAALFEVHGFSQLLFAHVVSMMAVALFLAWITRREWDAGGGEKITWTGQVKMIRFGIPLIFSGMAFWGLTTADRIFLRQFSTLSELGVYSLATSFAGAAIILQNVFSVVWAPTVYKWVAAGENLEKVDRVTEHVLTAVIFLFIFAGLFSWMINWFLPDHYNTVQYVFIGCMAYPLFYTLSETTVVGLGVARRSGLAFAAALIAALVGIVANFLMVERFGASGAAAATAIAFWVFLVGRTEFSSLVWRPLPRFKLYVSTFFVLILVVLYTIVGWKYPTIFTFVWLGALLIAIPIFRSSLSEALRFVSAMLSARSY